MSTTDESHVRRAPSRTWLLPVGVVGAWLFLVLSAVAVERLTGRPVPTCMFKRVTGYPCVGCGSTRGVLAVFRGEFITAFAFNPLVMTLLIIGPIWLGVRWHRERRRVSNSLPPRYWSHSQRMVGGIIAIALFAANWAYVLWRGN